MKLSGLAAFLIYDLLQRHGVEDGRTFCFRHHRDGHQFDAEIPLNGERVAILQTKHMNSSGYHLEVDRPGQEDRVAVFRERTVLAVHKNLLNHLGTTKLDARLEGNTITLMLCADLGCWTFPEDGNPHAEQ